MGHATLEREPRATQLHKVPTLGIMMRMVATMLPTLVPRYRGMPLVLAVAQEPEPAQAMVRVVGRMLHRRCRFRSSCATSLISRRWSGVVSRS